MKTKPNVSIHPVDCEPNPTAFDTTNVGLTKRELAAFLALQGLMANMSFIYIENNGDIKCRIDASKYAVQQADALIKELNKDET